MKIFDAHCDVLSKMWGNPAIRFYNDPTLHINYKHLKRVGGKNVQCFAIYVPEHVQGSRKFQAALEMIDIFYRKILTFPDIHFIRKKADLNRLKEQEIGAILTLEGCDAVGNDLTKLRTLFRLGVRSVGLTWNYANAVADGILEERGAGLSKFGKSLVQTNNEHHVWTDVSHLSEQGFWDVIELADYVIASHSNVKTLTGNPRNLTDAQICALIEKDAVIGITFVPKLLEINRKARMFEILKHVEYICSLGGSRNIGFGSDFDGIDETPEDMPNYSAGYQVLIDELLKRYPEQLVKGFLYYNFVRIMPE